MKSNSSVHFFPLWTVKGMFPSLYSDIQKFWAAYFLCDRLKFITCSCVGAPICWLAGKYLKCLADRIKSKMHFSIRSSTTGWLIDWWIDSCFGWQAAGGPNRKNKRHSSSAAASAHVRFMTQSTWWLWRATCLVKRGDMTAATSRVGGGGDGGKRWTDVGN